VNPEALPEDVHAAFVRAGARLGMFAGRLLWYDTVTSTNDVASRMASSGAPEGTAVAANMQTMGRGRLGRRWASPPGAGLYASAIFRPAAHVAPMMTISAGAAIADGIEASSGLQTILKWPNDVYAGPRKLAGILAEAAATHGIVDHTILGFGINLMPAAYPAEIAARATSLESELGRPVDRGLVLAECFASLASRYEDLRAGRPEAIIASWRRRGAPTFGRRVQWDASGGVHEGVVEDIDDRGALVVRSGSRRLRIVSGEVRWIP
jgi:BirA family biotin operon repressor/biotin-[acetyl-CoA-carboxylase] ligase